MQEFSLNKRAYCNIARDSSPKTERKSGENNGRGQFSVCNLKS